MENGVCIKFIGTSIAVVFIDSISIVTISVFVKRYAISLVL